MKPLFVIVLVINSTLSCAGQVLSSIINAYEVGRIQNILSADNMQGRKAFTPGAERAADFISAEFERIGLKSFQNVKCFKQLFSLITPKISRISGSVDGMQLRPEDIVPISSLTELNITNDSDFEKIYIRKGADFRNEIARYLEPQRNFLVIVDPSFRNYFTRLNRFRENLFKSDKSAVFILGDFEAKDIVIQIKQEIYEQRGSNILGVIPGKSKKNELVIFSAHYDHLGTSKEGGTDTIYNGANDDASGITAVISLAKYFKAAKKNERTLVFAAFTAEEIGGFGSRFFSNQLDPGQIMAMFNIEMIGTESKWGKNSAYITGFEKSGLGKILQKNLKGSSFAFYSDPYPDQNLFYRSDNATLARLGVPAHTISTSKMDDEPNYHKVSDEISTLNIPNMTQIIQSIVISAGSIVNGKDTPTRVKAENLER